MNINSSVEFSPFLKLLDLPLQLSLRMGGLGGEDSPIDVPYDPHILPIGSYENDHFWVASPSIFGQSLSSLLLPFSIPV